MGGQGIRERFGVLKYTRMRHDLLSLIRMHPATGRSGGGRDVGAGWEMEGGMRDRDASGESLYYSDYSGYGKRWARGGWGGREGLR